MGEIAFFVPRAAHDARQSLHAFVHQVKTNISPFGRGHIDFESNAWDVAGLTSRNNKLKYLHFTQAGHAIRSNRGHVGPVPETSLLRQPFLNFAKAIIAYLHAIRPTLAIGERLQTLRQFEAALFDATGTTDPTLTTPEVLDRACQIMLERFAPKTAHSRANQLELIYQMMGELGLLAVCAIWKNPLPAPKATRNRVGKKFDEERQRQLPDPAALEALSEIFASSATDPVEAVVSSLFALMLCSPSRPVEVLRVPVNCLIPEWTDPETGKKGSGLRWFPAKGGAPTVKIVIPEMVQIATRAVERIKTVTDPARALARWYEVNPTKIFLPPQLEHLRNRQELSIFELHQLLFGGDIDSTPSERQRTSHWAKKNRLPVIRTEGKQGAGKPIRYYSFRDVENALLAQLPAGFPTMDSTTGMRYSEALCVIRLGQLNSCASFKPYQSVLRPISYGTVAGALKSNGDKQSIFEKRGLRGADGEYLSITPYMLRHYLNTLVRSNHKISEKEIADWSGRKDVRQNPAYDHVSDKDRLAYLRRAVGDKNAAVGPLAEIDSRILVTREKFASLKIITAHTTALGYCIHDFAMLPCQLHADCINCNELVCVKGDAESNMNIRCLERETRMLLTKAEEALNADEFNANIWVMHQAKTLEHASKLVALLNDPNVPDGAVIQLSGVTPASRLQQAEMQRLKNREDVSSSIKSLEQLHELLANQQPKG